jgi:hypothetical protein
MLQQYENPQYLALNEQLVIHRDGHDKKEQKQEERARETNEGRNNVWKKEIMN